MSGTLTPSRLRHAIVAAGAEPDLDLQDAITTAYEWHPGGGSALYAFASNGGNLQDEAQRQQLLTEVEESIAWVTQNAPQIDAGKFPEYAEDAEAASEQGMTTSQLQLKRLNNLKAIGSQAVIVKEASVKEAAFENAPGEAEAHELELYAENTGELYPQKQQIIKNLQRKMDKGTYDPNLAWRLWLYWVDEAAKRYAQENGGVWHQMFPKAIRTQVAKSISTDQEQMIRNGEYNTDSTPAPTPASTPAAPVASKAAKTLISADVFRRAITECQDLMGALAGSGSELEGKLNKIHHELNKLEAGAGGNLDFILDDEASPSTAKWARELIRALSTIKSQIPGAQKPAEAPVSGVTPIPSASGTQTPIQGSASKEAWGFTEQTARAIVQFARTHKDQLAAMLNNRAQGPAAVLQALQKVPGGANMGGKIMPALQQWLTGAASDSAFAGMIEQLFNRKQGAWDPQEAVHIASGSLILAGFKPSEVSASGNVITVAGLKVNPHVLRHTAKIASDYGLQVKLQTASRRKKALAPTDQQQMPAPGQPVQPGAPVAPPAAAAPAPAPPAATVPPPPPSAAGNHAGPSNPANPTNQNPGATAQQPAQAPQPVKTYGAPAQNPTMPYGQKASALVMAAGEQGDLGAAIESAYEWHSGQSSYLYSFASLGGVLFKESWRGGLENEVESAIEAVNRKPEAYDPDELEKLQNLLAVVSTIPAKTNDEQEEGHMASVTASDDSLVATLAEIESMLTATQELADKAVGVARLSNNSPLVTNVERLNVKVYEGLLAVRTAKADAQTSVKVPDSVAPAVGLTPVTASSRRKAAVEFLARELEAGDIFSVPGQPMVYKAQASAPSPNNPSIILIQAETKTGETTTLRVQATAKLNLGSQAEFQSGAAIPVAASKTFEELQGACSACGDAPATQELRGSGLCDDCYSEFTRGPEKGKCDYCGQPVPPELAEENVCSGCAGMLSGAVSSFGEDEARGKPYDMVMASLVVAGEEGDENGPDPEGAITAGMKTKIHPKVKGYTDEGRAQATSWQADEEKAAEEAKKPSEKKAADQLDSGPDASQGDNVENAIEWINGNGKDLDDLTVQQLRDALQAAGYTQQVADKAVTELLGEEALQALATPVKSLLGA